MVGRVRMGVGVRGNGGGERGLGRVSRDPTLDFMKIPNHLFVEPKPKHIHI